VGALHVAEVHDRRPDRSALPQEAHMDGFKKFLLRGNVVDLAVAVVIGAAFAAIVTAFVAAFITPLVGVVTGASGDFTEATFTVADVEFPYGQFVQALLTFVIIAAVVYFFVVKPINALMERYKTEPEVDAETKQCPECLSNIPVPASRCAFCTVEQLDVPK
jgi:large conductance mechanosensitive channel